MEQNLPLSGQPFFPGGMTRPPETALPSQPPLPPGAVRNPCCMGSEAGEMLGVLTGFIEEELADERRFRAMACRAPSWAKQSLRQLAEEAGEHACTLMSAVYLITGACYRPGAIHGEVAVQGWCPALRERYHTEACGGLNYARAAEGTADPCLRRILERLSREEYRHADVLMGLLQRSMGC